MSLARAEEPIVKRRGGGRAIPCFRRVGSDSDTLVLAFSQSLLHFALVREVIRFRLRLERRRGLCWRFASVANRVTGLNDVKANEHKAASNDYGGREKVPTKFDCLPHMPVSSFNHPCTGRPTALPLRLLPDRMKIARARRFRYRAGMRTTGETRGPGDQKVKSDASHVDPHFDTF
ncbi:hypothetical protein AB3X96_36910 [Paraburkholderia sp. BR13439]|uniref:hypothetical protein n=1 Tax=unclassified Paraburkholderia TaxID=2615204 RepID=UPI0034CDF3AA